MKAFFRVTIVLFSRIHSGTSTTTTIPISWGKREKERETVRKSLCCTKGNNIHSLKCQKLKWFSLFFTPHAILYNSNSCPILSVILLTHFLCRERRENEEGERNEFPYKQITGTITSFCTKATFEDFVSDESGKTFLSI